MALPDNESVFPEERDESSEEERTKVTSKKDSSKKSHPCTYPGCKAEFLRPSKLERHYCMHTGERRFVCDVVNCDKAYTNLSYLKRHKLTHNAVKETFPCTICNMTFTVQHNLKRHCKRIHENPQGTYHLPKVCEVCKEEFPKRNLLRAHMIEAHDRNLYKCQLCPKSFSVPTRLKRHLMSNVHQSFPCKICSISFESLVELRLHNSEEHLDLYYYYKCDMCGKSYANKSRLKNHISDHMKTSVMICHFEGCNRIYYFKRNLEQHIRTFHQGERWRCPSCPAQLSSKQKLKIHIEKIHVNPKPRKPPPTKENRKRRWDARMPKKSAVSQLVGLVLPNETEKDIMNRHLTKSEAS